MMSNSLTGCRALTFLLKVWDLKWTLTETFWTFPSLHALFNCYQMGSGKQWLTEHHLHKLFLLLVAESEALVGSGFLHLMIAHLQNSEYRKKVNYCFFSCVLIYHFYLADSRSHQLIHEAALMPYTGSYRVSWGRRKEILDLSGDCLLASTNTDQHLFWVKFSWLYLSKCLLWCLRPRNCCCISDFYFWN